jgi:xylulokinase
MTGTTMVVFAPSDTVPAYNPNSIIPCHKNYDGKYCLLSWTPTAGIALKWFKNNFCEDFDFRALDDLAKDVPVGSAGLTFLPYLCGSTMPKYRPDAKGAFIGLTMEHTGGHAVRSILEAVACMLKSNLDYLGVTCKEVRSMGGGSLSPLWCQIKADMTGKDIAILENNETACLGSAILAGVGIGVYDDIKAVCRNIVKTKKVYKPTGTDYSACYQNFLNAENMILGE